MACGTGKTFTSLKIAEHTVKAKGAPAVVLFLVPSISLLSQSLREWSAQTETPMRAFAVCSDKKVGKVSTAGEDINVHDLALPATTDPKKLMAQVAGSDGASPLTVVFSTYQSIQVISDAQKLGLPEFDLIICDEAHRTTGVTLADSDESNFVKIHNNDFIKGAKRLYMTATPRIFTEETKNKATENAAVLTSMDEQKDYGPEFHRLGFGDAVSHDLLTDYKVLVLTIDEKYIAGPLQMQLADENNELSLDDATKIVGCWNGLAKRSASTVEGTVTDFGSDVRPMQRAVAFLRDIKSSKKLADKFATVIDAYDDADDETLRCEVHHVDGTYNALQRNHELDWLKAPLPDNECRILSNARCLSEGVDVPDLDAVLFLNPRNSVVDVVQSVGRVMRKAEGKEYGYIILPVGIPAGMTPNQALADNKRFKIVWQVLQALRAHDDRFNATVNKLELNKKKNTSILVGHVGGGDEEGVGDSSSDSTTEADESGHVAEQIALFQLEDWRDAIFAKIVEKVGTRTYWEGWAKDVAEIAQAQEVRIKALLDGANPEITEAFERFITALKANLNDSITADDAINMLCQHLITKPVFDALFENYDFAGHNPVSLVMQSMVDTLQDQALEAETQRLEKFYDSVRMRASDIDNAEGKQHIIVELYEKFFRLGFKKTAKALGIVYTPVQIVDFILRAANDALMQEFGTSLSDENVHILDPFTGTGTFIVRLLQSGIIKPEDLLRKYTSELHANEIILLAYYIAAINIEATFHGIHGGEYKPFNGIVLTDTFQISEAGDTMDAVMFPQNNNRIIAQQASPIRVVFGNPPYSSGQKSANDDNANMSYPTLDAAIRKTYGKRTPARNKNGLYNSYIRALRWATDRLGEAGIVAYVVNGGWIDDNAMAGVRFCLADEFEKIYVFNLRGNQLGDWRKEGGKVFGDGSQNTIAIVIAIKTANDTGSRTIHYKDIGDYLTRNEKLNILRGATIESLSWSAIEPNSSGDWINPRSELFDSFTPIGNRNPPQGSQAIFESFSRALETGRDVWVYNFSREQVAHNATRLVGNYATLHSLFESYCRSHSIARPKEPDVVAFLSEQKELNSPAFLKWSRSLRQLLARKTQIVYRPENVQTAIYRPFSKQVVYYDNLLNHERSGMPAAFPTGHEANVGIYQVGMGSEVPFSVLMTDCIPDLHLTGAGSGGQFFPRFVYQGPPTDQLSFDNLAQESQQKLDNISEDVHKEYQKAFGTDTTKDDIFYYVYGLMHAPSYRSTFKADLRKMLPRIPRSVAVDDFLAFAQAGRSLAELHVGYEAVDPYDLKEVLNPGLGNEPADLYRVTSLAFASKSDHSAIKYNKEITLTGIPDDAHRYQLGSRSALEWLLDRYRWKKDEPSGIVNDPNVWCHEHNDPRYIIDLIKRIVTVSVETMKIVDSLPELGLS